MSTRNSTEVEMQGWRLTTNRLLWLSIALALVLVPHVGRVPPWVTGGFAMLVLWRLYAHARGTEPSRWIVAALVVAMIPGIFLSYGSLLGRSAGVALLAILAGMKLLETRNLRDAYVVIFLGFFLVVTNFLFSQSMPTGLYMCVVVVLLTATMVTLTTDARVLRARERLKLSGQLLLQAIPVMIVLFVLFPRLATPLWGLPKDAYSAQSGLSDTMRPGQISELSLSDEIAFRVRFTGKKPDSRQLYWRGPVLWNTDGTTWRGRRAGRSRQPPHTELLGEPLDYEVTIEPHDRTWLFALDVPATVPRRVQITEDYELVSSRKVYERRRYRVRSYPEYRMRWLSLKQRVRALALPDGAHPKTRALGLAWRTELRSHRAIIGRALAYLNQQPFFYTLQPPLLEGDTVDQFLFETRRGFCEHYSAAFAVLMRAAGIPARVVTGYQGGEYIAIGDYLVVRQRDAHAWVEVWLSATGWTRVDPTAAVSPDRIDLGLDAVVPPTIGPRALGIRPTGAVEQAWRWLRQSIDAANNSWNQWVLGYDARRQARLLRQFGLDSRNYFGIAIALSVGIGLALAGVFWWLLRQRRKPDRAIALYGQFCAELAKRGMVRRSSEGPMDFAGRVIRARPALAEPVTHVTRLYVDVRYGFRSEALEELAQSVRTLSQHGLNERGGSR